MSHWNGYQYNTLYVSIVNSSFNSSSGGVYIDSNKEGCSIEFQNRTIYNNITLSVKTNGVGVYINLIRYGNGSIVFHNCTIYNNNAQYISRKRKSVH